VSAIYWSAGILPACVLRFSGGRLFEFRINADIPRAGKMPALQTLLAHVIVPRAGKMPALQDNENCWSLACLNTGPPALYWDGRFFFVMALSQLRETGICSGRSKSGSTGLRDAVWRTGMHAAWPLLKDTALI
jgi:hypothetical protein